MLLRSVARGSVRGSPWPAYRADPLSTERGREAHLDSVKLTMPGGDIARQRADVVLDQPCEPFGGAESLRFRRRGIARILASSSPRWRTGCDLVAKIQKSKISWTSGVRSVSVR